MTRQELTCLHTAQDGEIWSIEAGGNPKPFLHLDNPLRLRSGTYRVIGCPANYQLLTELFSALNRKDEESRILIGSPQICRYRNQTCKEVLSCLSVLNTHDGLKNRWHVMNNQLYNNYLLLWYFNTEGVSDVVINIFRHHCLKKTFSFLGLNSMKLAVYLISEIVDPRRFLNSRRPYRLSRLESYFGLKPGQFRELWNPAASPTFDLPPHQMRAVLLMDIVRNLPREGWVASETQDIQDEMQQLLRSCRLVLGFVVRNWLRELGVPGYFDPQKFFKQVGNQADYRRQFED